MALLTSKACWVIPVQGLASSCQLFMIIEDSCTLIMKQELGAHVYRYANTKAKAQLKPKLARDVKSKNEECFYTSSKKKTKEEVTPLLNRAGDLVIMEMEKSEIFNAFVPPFLLVRFFLRCPSSFTLVTESVGVKHYPQQTMIKWGTSKANWTYKSPRTQTGCIWLGWFHCKAALLKDHRNWERFTMTGKRPSSRRAMRIQTITGHSGLASGPRSIMV